MDIIFIILCCLQKWDVDNELDDETTRNTDNKYDEEYDDDHYGVWFIKYGNDNDYHHLSRITYHQSKDVAVCITWEACLPGQVVELASALFIKNKSAICKQILWHNRTW